MTREEALLLIPQWRWYDQDNQRGWLLDALISLGLMKLDEQERTFFSYAFNGRTNPARLVVAIAENGDARIYVPTILEPIVVTRNNPISIDISGDGPGSDVAIKVELKR